MHLIAEAVRISYHKLNFIAIDLQLYKILKITGVSFFGTCCSVYSFHAAFRWLE